ncbi:MAG: ribonuclease III [Betaproteobacteria bacterium]|nr:ribonuclease III [Betaproteobacteria bacterium]
MDYGPLQRKLGYSFAQASLLQQALTHRSHGTPHNERIEFLGDSVLNCCVAQELYRRFGDLKEGELSRLRANLVRQETLAELAQELELGTYLRLGEGELKSGGFRRPSILADGLEALFGAIFLDGGFAAVLDVIRGLYASLLEHLDPQAPGKDPKTLLQELLQARKIDLPQYAVVATQGAAHKQLFQVECQIPQLAIRTTGFGASRRIAEQEAAQLAFAQTQK